MSKKKTLVVSLLKTMYDTHPETVSLDVVYQLLILESLRSDTEKHRYYRSSGQKAEAQSIKDSMTNFTPSVILSGGKSRTDVTGYTGLSMADFDHVPSDDLERCFRLLDTDPYVMLAYVTISGEGMRVIYLTDVADVSRHADAFSQGNAYYSRLLGYPYDKQCRNVARTSILCYCPQAIYHPLAEAMLIDPVPQEKEKNPSRKAEKGHQRKRYSATAEEAGKAVLSLLEDTGKTYAEGHYNEYVSEVFYRMNRYGVDEAEACAWVVGRFSDYEPSKLSAIARSVYLHTDEFGVQKLPVTKEKHARYATLPEMEQFISSQAEVRNNTVTERREIRMDGETAFRDITDRDENTLWSRANKSGVCSSSKAIQMILNSEYANDYNPFNDYLCHLDVWTGETDYIRLLTDTVQTSAPELFYEYFRKWFVGLIASLLNPDIVNHEILVFIGEQGHYKTTWMNRLLPPELKRYFFTKTNSNRMTKDDKISLSEFALICFEEIDNMRSSEMNQLKAMVSLPTVNERNPYARNKSFRPHVASFCGTGNNLAFLNDPTGTRRWLAFEVLSISDPYAMTLPYKEIYAQGLALYRSGFRYWFDKEEVECLARHNERFEVPCIERELVLMYYRKPLPGEHGVFVSTTEILQRVNALIKTPLCISVLGMELRKLGFQYCRSNGLRGYRVMELSPEEISARKRNIDLPDEQKLVF